MAWTEKGYVNVVIVTNRLRIEQWTPSFW